MEPQEEGKKCAPEERFQLVWDTCSDIQARHRGKLACDMAEKLVPEYCQTLEKEELQRLFGNLETDMAYHAYYLKLMHQVRVEVGNELLRRADRGQ